MNAIVSRNLIRLVAAPAATPTAFAFTGNAALDAAQRQYPFFGGYEGALLFHHRGGHRLRLTGSMHSEPERSFDPALCDPPPPS